MGIKMTKQKALLIKEKRLARKKNPQNRRKKNRPRLIKGYHAIKLKESLDLPMNNEWIKNKKIIVMVHFYYHRLLKEIFKYIDQFPLDIDLWVSIVSTDPMGGDIKTQEKIKYIEKKYKNVRIFIVPNKGKDIGGKLKLMKEYLKENKYHDWIIFAHDKDGVEGRVKRQQLLAAIFHLPHVKKILYAFKNDTTIKMCGGGVREGAFASDTICSGLSNKGHIEELLPKFKIKKIPDTTAFVGGTMFWVDAPFYKKYFKNINIDNIIKYLEEGNVREPSYTHAIERIFGIIVTHKGYKIGGI